MTICQMFARHTLPGRYVSETGHFNTTCFATHLDLGLFCQMASWDPFAIQAQIWMQLLQCEMLAPPYLISSKIMKNRRFSSKSPSVNGTARVNRTLHARTWLTGEWATSGQRGNDALDTLRRVKKCRLHPILESGQSLPFCRLACQRANGPRRGDLSAKLPPVVREIFNRT